MQRIRTGVDSPPSYYEAAESVADEPSVPGQPALARLRAEFLNNARAQLRAGERFPSGLSARVHLSDYPRLLRDDGRDGLWTYDETMRRPSLKAKTQSLLAREIADEVGISIQRIIPRLRREYAGLHARTPNYRQMVTRLKQYEQSNELPRVYRLMRDPRIVSSFSVSVPPRVVHGDAGAQEARSARELQLGGRYVHVLEAVVISLVAAAASIAVRGIALSIGIWAAMGVALLTAYVLMFAASSQRAGILPVHPSLSFKQALCSSLPLLAAAAWTAADGEMWPVLICVAVMTGMSQYGLSHERFLQTSLADRLCPWLAPAT